MHLLVVVDAHIQYVVGVVRSIDIYILWAQRYDDDKWKEETINTTTYSFASKQFFFASKQNEILRSF